MLHMFSTFKATPTVFGAQSATNIGIAGLLAQIAAITDTALFVQKADAIQQPWPAMIPQKAADDWSVWVNAFGCWSWVMIGGVSVDDAVIAVIERLQDPDFQGTEFLICPPGAAQPGIVS